ncbi:response regulator transcription factor [Lichenicola cladoniae]|uniref:Response regulator transcription factor n=2 Tax=Lichenicola cladoniae TaxID=1484109 RepID=A0A6M8HM56_9PROT|nr:response regulator transcription factor [Acetobacteraceae bacterium]QKE89391.1 response regulator transcription factor [Lichenicola cladoniae]
MMIVEDDPAIGDMLLRFLIRSGMPAQIARSGREAMLLKETFGPDIVLLDLELPDTNGISLIPWLLRTGDCGIIVLSGNGEEAERVVGIELGADDYIIKPPSMRELVARIRAVHRRLARGRNNEIRPEASTTLRLAHAEVDLRKRVVIVENGDRIPLTGAEGKALELLVAARGEPLSREELCRQALRRPLGSEDRAVDQLIVGLRKKLSSRDSDDQIIVSVRGAGYALSA